VAEPHRSKPQKKPQKNIGSNHILILGEENFFNHNSLLIKLMEQEKSTTNKGLVGLVILAVVIGGYFYFTKDQTVSKTGGQQVTTASFEDNGQTLSEEIINCEFKVISSFIYQNKDDAWSEENRKVYYETADESKPNLITFAGLSSKQPRIKGNAGDSPLVMLKNDNETIVLVEENAFGDMFTYTIFKQEKVAVWHKAYKLITAPYGLVSMGHCY